MKEIPAKEFKCHATLSEIDTWIVWLHEVEPGYASMPRRVGVGDTREDAIQIGQAALRSARKEQERAAVRAAQSFEITEDM